MEGKTTQSEDGRGLAECGVAIVFLIIVTLERTVSPVRFSLPIAVFGIVSTTEAIGIKRVRIGARVWREVNGSEKKSTY